MEAGVTMPQPVSPRITSTPSNPGQPYDAADGSDPTPPWDKLPAGPANIHTGRITGEFVSEEDRWRQT